MSNTFLRRYTDLTALIYLLHNKKITLLNPDNWDDSNDSHFLREYKIKNGFRSVLALCFTETAERYHYWRVFGKTSSGVCIQFKRDVLLKSMRKTLTITAKSVNYLTLEALKKGPLNLDTLPFLKRHAYADEREFRMIYQSSEDQKTLDVPIPLSAIEKITLSPWLNANLFQSVKNTLKSVDGCDDLTIVKSTLIGNDRWKAAADDAVP